MGLGDIDVTWATGVRNSGTLVRRASTSTRPRTITTMMDNLMVRRKHRSIDQVAASSVPESLAP